MGFLKRLLGGSKAREAASQTDSVAPRAVSPEPVSERQPEPDVLSEVEDYLSSLAEPSSVPEARLTIKQLQLRKRELQALKREAAAHIAQLRSEWRTRTAGRYSTVGFGRGFGGRVVRSAIQGKRRAEKMAHADAVNEIEAMKAEIDDHVSDVDRAILGLEEYILRNK